MLADECAIPHETWVAGTVRTLLVKPITAAAALPSEFHERYLDLCEFLRPAEMSKSPSRQPLLTTF